MILASGRHLYKMRVFQKRESLCCGHPPPSKITVSGIQLAGGEGYGEVGLPHVPCPFISPTSLQRIIFLLSLLKVLHISCRPLSCKCASSVRTAAPKPFIRISRHILGEHANPFACREHSSRSPFPVSIHVSAPLSVPFLSGWPRAFLNIYRLRV